MYASFITGWRRSIGAAQHVQRWRKRDVFAMGRGLCCKVVIQTIVGGVQWESKVIAVVVPFLPYFCIL
jgi:hypothetical protein